MTTTATLVEVDGETRRATFERDGRLFNVPLTVDECRVFGAQLYRAFTVTIEAPPPGPNEVGI